MGQPVIEIIFIQKAVTAIKRSQRGVTLVILKDDTQKEAGVDLFKYEADITKDKYSEENIEILKRCFYNDVFKLRVVHVPTSTTEFADVKKLIDKQKFNYICTTIEEFQKDLASYIKSRNKQSKGRKYKAVLHNVTVADDKHLINVRNDSVHGIDEKRDIKMNEYLPRITSVLANLPMNRSCTFYDLEDIDGVDESFIDDDENTIDAWVDKGYLVLFQDDDETVKINRGVNSLTTYTSTETEDMSKIIIVESMDIILEDLYTTFKKYWVGKYKNRLNNQYLFISAVNTYFLTLTSIEAGEILDEEFNNIAYIDVEAQRQAWLSVGKTEAEDWDEDTVKKRTFKSAIFLAGNIKILDAVEDLHFKIAME